MASYPMLILLLYLLTPTSALAEAIRPYEEVRALARVQDGLSQGKKNSTALQRILVRRISKRFRRASPNVWAEKRNATAAIKYLMSGGDPTFAERGLVASHLPAALKPLFQASLAYAKGEVEEARVRFSKIEPRETDAMLAGHVALIKSLVVSAKDQKAAMRLLDDARLLGHGTLVEEAALRRQVGVLVHQKSQKLFQHLATRYVRRFQKSIYAGAFRQHLADGLTNSSFKLDEYNKAWLGSLFDQLDPTMRPAYGIIIAERAVVLGRASLVRLVTLRVQSNVGRSSEIEARAHLFHAAIAVTGDEHAKALGALTKLTNFSLSSFEGKLREAAIAIAKGIVMPVGKNIKKGIEAATSPQSRAAVSDPFSSTRVKAIAVIGDADRFLDN